MRGAGAIDNDEAARLFRAIGEAVPMFGTGTSLYRLSIPPTVVEAAIGRLKPKSWIADWAGGLLLVEFDEAPANLHAVAKTLGGHATALRTAAPVGEVFSPLDPATFALTQRIKGAFDPKRILNPGRMYKDL